MSKGTIVTYRAMEQLLAMAREQRGDPEHTSIEEQRVLDNMDELWYQLTPAERRTLARENP